MHGKQRSQATYRTNSNINNPSIAPVHKREYNYWVSGNGKLLNNVPCLKFDANYENLIIGEDYEFYVEQLEHQNNCIENGANYNTDGMPILPLPGLIGRRISENNLFRSTTTNKIVYRKGILKEIIENNEGEITKTSNLFYDPFTGDALLTEVNNSFNNPVYNYSYPGHWYYKGMLPSYQNSNATIFNADVSSGVVSLGDAAKYVMEGDQLLLLNNGGTLNGTIYYVTDVNLNDFTIEDISKAAPSSLTDVTFKVVKTGRRNLQSIAAGAIESLQNPVTENTNLLLLFNQNVTNQVTGSTHTLNGIKFCKSNGTSVTRDVTFTRNSGGISISITTPTEEVQLCSVSLAFTPSSTALGDYRFISYIPSSGALLLENIETGEVHNITLDSGDLQAFEQCFKSCFTVLNASAAEFKNGNWNYNYSDAGSPQIKHSSTGSTYDLNASNGNDYHYVKFGIYLVQKNYAYKVKRLQS